MWSKFVGKNELVSVLKIRKKQHFSTEKQFLLDRPNGPIYCCFVRRLHIESRVWRMRTHQHKFRCDRVIGSVCLTHRHTEHEMKNEKCSRTIFRRKRGDDVPSIFWAAMCACSTNYAQWTLFWATSGKCKYERSTEAVYNAQSFRWVGIIFFLCVVGFSQVFLRFFGAFFSCCSSVFHNLPHRSVCRQCGVEQRWLAPIETVHFTQSETIDFGIVNTKKNIEMNDTFYVCCLRAVCNAFSIPPAQTISYTVCVSNELC